MKAKPCRIWTNYGPRELHHTSRNDYGDILLTLDGGEVWQFTPGNPRNPVLPSVDEVESIGGRIPFDSIANPTKIGFIGLKNPARDLCGNFRILPPQSKAAKDEPAPRKPPPNPKGREPDYNPEDDARIFSRWEKAQMMGRVSAVKFLEENPDIFENQSLKARAIKLTQLKDRVRVRKSKAREMARRKK